MLIPRRPGPLAALAAASLATLAIWAPARAATPPAEVAAAPPNVIFVLTDDLSWNLVQFMPEVQRLQRDGVTFTNYTVTDSLCCPSRSSIFTGKFPHDTGIFTNSSPDGGFDVFHNRGHESKTFATALQARGYATGFMGKYLNGYLPGDTQGGSLPYVPPGWSEWDVAGNGYPNYNYDLNENHTVVHYGSTPADYLTDVIADKGSAFIQRSAASGTPFLLELATFTPHAPFTPAPEDLNDFPGLTAPRTAAFNKLPVNAPSWLAGNGPLTTAEKTAIDTNFRKRAQSVQAIDRLIRDLRATLVATGQAANTYIVFSADNGFHLGEYRLTQGKMTAFDTDVRVPLIVTGPGVPAGTTRTEVVQNIDLAPTFQRIGGGTVASDVNGRSILPLLQGEAAPNWRTASLIEHHGPNQAADDPDAQTQRNGNPTTYSALRTATYTYVEYANGEREYYDRLADPQQLNNIAGQLTAARLAALHTALQGLVTCHTHESCWTAGHVTA
ncbi:arylsulfatase A-like enzyme [Allocatelliglobosispora scoriae]|uniref:Arylsulfatase A-like enzyme n=1 Tax=Allocatelliglobosispora scoriae TaxID=643052 RepID=A0A841BPY3_9ACTN|nr:sulfatase [Allocatelliglobosispora scoriae]MBB5868880.1 arylsulfatase A-like enzyme [Allocatelliglobosispora scoriae]